MFGRFRFVSVLTVLLLSSGSRADETAAARAVLDRGIQAMGGAKQLARHRALSGKTQGTVTLNDKRVPVTNEWTVQGLDQLRWTSELTGEDGSFSIVLVLDRGKGWLKGNDSPASPLENEPLAALRHAVAGLRMAETLTPLLEKNCTLSSLGELKVKDGLAVGVKATRKGLPDLDLFFDKATHLPVKVEMRLKEGADDETTYTAYFAEYKKIAGRQHFTKLTVERDGKVLIDVERSEIKAVDPITNETFAKP